MNSINKTVFSTGDFKEFEIKLKRYFIKYGGGRRNVGWGLLLHHENLFYIMKEEEITVSTAIMISL